jgi:acyl-CoA thioester hydrolase
MHAASMFSRQTHSALRVRYSEVDKMGPVYNSRVLEWFEFARSEHLRNLGFPYTEFEERGVFLPIVEAHVEFLGRAGYDDSLELVISMAREGRARLRFENQIVRAGDRTDVARGYTIHGFTDPSGRPNRPPDWLTEFLDEVCGSE